MTEEKQDLGARFAPQVGERVETKSAVIIVGGMSVCIYPMTMRSLESLTELLSEPLTVLMEEVLARPDMLADTESEGGRAAVGGLLRGLWDKHVAAALVGAPKLFRQVVAVLINLEPDDELLQFASLSELVDAVSALNELNDFAAIAKQVAGLFGGLMQQYGAQALTAGVQGIVPVGASEDAQEKPETK